MSGITYADLISYSGLKNTPQSWADLLAGVDANAEYLRKNVSEPLGEAWTGTAAELATGKVNTAHGGLIQSALAIKDIQGWLEWLNARLTVCRNHMDQLVSSIEKAGEWVVSSDGVVGVSPHWKMPGSPTPQQDRAQAAQQAAHQAEIQKILDKANSDDADTAANLNNDYTTADQPLFPGPAVLASASTTAGRWTTVSTDGSLWQIAEQEYGNGNEWRRIYEANKSQIPDPNVIHAGQRLVIPALDSPGTPTVAAPPPSPALAHDPTRPQPARSPDQTPASSPPQKVMPHPDLG
jgi:LysM domain